jgi:hypothetical protein
MALQEYFGLELFKDIRDQALEEHIAEFSQLTKATKVGVSDKLDLENRMLKIGLDHCVNIVDEQAAKCELKENEIKYYKDTYGEVDQAYIDKNNLLVVRTAERRHFKHALVDYMEGYNKKKESQKTQQTKQTAPIKTIPPVANSKPSK